MMGLIGYFISNSGVFFFVMALAVPTLVSLVLIRPDEIDYELARGAADGENDGNPESIRELLKSRPLTIFLCCAVLFHFANAAMLPLLGEMLAKSKGRSSMMFMSAWVVTTQFTITLLAACAGRTAGSWGRKPLLLIGFGVLPIRGVLYTLTNSIYLLVGIQVLDGIGAGIFGVVSVLVIADLTRGTGRSYAGRDRDGRGNRRGAQPNHCRSHCSPLQRSGRISVLGLCDGGGVSDLVALHAGNPRMGWSGHRVAQFPDSTSEYRHMTRQHLLAAQSSGCARVLLASGGGRELLLTHHREERLCTLRYFGPRRSSSH